MASALGRCAERTDYDSMSQTNHFVENLEIMTFSLSDDDMQVISALNQNLRSNVLNDPETFPW